MNKNKKELQLELNKMVRLFGLSEELITKIKNDNKNLSEIWKELRNQHSEVNKDLNDVIKTKKLIFETYSSDTKEFKKFVEESKECKELDRCLLLKNDLQNMINNRKIEEYMQITLKNLIKDCEKSKYNLTKSMEFKLVKDFYIEIKKTQQPADITNFEVKNLELCSELINLINEQYNAEIK